MFCHLQRLITVIPKFVILYDCTVLCRIHFYILSLMKHSDGRSFSALSCSFLILGGSCAGVSVSLQSVSNPSLPKVHTKVLNLNINLFYQKMKQLPPPPPMLFQFGSENWISEILGSLSLERLPHNRHCHLHAFFRNFLGFWWFLRLQRCFPWTL